MAKKGTPEYEEWLKKYREKRSTTTVARKAPKQPLKAMTHAEWLANRQNEVASEKAQAEQLKSNDIASFSKDDFIKSFTDKANSYSLTIEDVLYMSFIAGCDIFTFSIDEARKLKSLFNLEDDVFDVEIASQIKSYSLDTLKLRLQGIYNFYNVNVQPDSYPVELRNRYTASAFQTKYSNSLKSLILYFS